MFPLNTGRFVKPGFVFGKGDAAYLVRPVVTVSAIGAIPKAGCCEICWRTVFSPFFTDLKILKPAGYKKRSKTDAGQAAHWKAISNRQSSSPVEGLLGKRTSGSSATFYCL